MTAHAHRSPELLDLALDGGELQMVLSATPAGVICAQHELQRFIGQHDMGARAVYKLELIVEELLMNTVKYGVSDGADHAIRVHVVRAGDHLELTIEDDGAPFDPRVAPEPRPYESLETATPGGLGLSLVRKMSSTFTYERPDQAPAARIGGFRPVNRSRIIITDA